MGVAYNSRIVTDGLVLCLDAGNSKSYPGSGTVWTDLSGNGNNGTLTNGPTFSSANLGSLSFDGSNDFVSCGNATNLQITVGTISAWIKASNLNTGLHGIIVKQNAWGLFLNNNILQTFSWGGAGFSNSGITIGNGNWNHVTMSFTETTVSPTNNGIFYVNGSSITTSTVRHSNNAIELQIGNGGPAQPQFFGGNISQVSIYNRALTATEIQQNYLATKSRYGL